MRADAYYHGIHAQRRAHRDLIVDLDYTHQSRSDSGEGYWGLNVAYRDG